MSGFFWVRFADSVCYKLSSLNSVPYVIFGMKQLKVFATTGIVITRIVSNDSVHAGCHAVEFSGAVNGGRALKSVSRMATTLDWHRWSPASLPVIGYPTFHIFPVIIDGWNPIGIFSVSNVHNISAAAEVNVLQTMFSSATSAPGMFGSQTDLLTMNNMHNSWCSGNIVRGRLAIDY